MATNGLRWTSPVVSRVGFAAAPTGTRWSSTRTARPWPATTRCTRFRPVGSWPRCRGRSWPLRRRRTLLAGLGTDRHSDRRGGVLVWEAGRRPGVAAFAPFSEKESFDVNITVAAFLPRTPTLGGQRQYPARHRPGQAPGLRLPLRHRLALLLRCNSDPKTRRRTSSLFPRTANCCFPPRRGTNPSNSGGWQSGQEARGGSSKGPGGEPPLGRI